MIIYFVRHGQTEEQVTVFFNIDLPDSRSNIRGIIQGQIDTPLIDRGREEARRLAQRLKDVKFDEAWSSSLSRARETADIVLQHHPGLTLGTNPGLMERGLGSLEGRRWLRGEKLPDDVEASDVFRKRITQWFTAFLSSHSSDSHLGESTITAHPTSERTILVTSHGAYLTTLLSILLHPPFSFTIPDDLDIHASCLNTSIMRVHIRSRADVLEAVDAPKANDWVLYIDALRRLEERELRDERKSGKKVKSEWVGLIQTWADVRHLDDEWEDVAVADDMGDTE